MVEKDWPSDTAERKVGQFPPVSALRTEKNKDDAYNDVLTSFRAKTRACSLSAFDGSSAPKRAVAASRVDIMIARREDTEICRRISATKP